jgi:hypothetical protein
MTANCHPLPALEVYGSTINHVSDFKYLGSMMGSSAADLKCAKLWLGLHFGNLNASGEYTLTYHRQSEGV